MERADERATFAFAALVLLADAACGQAATTPMSRQLPRIVNQRDITHLQQKERKETALFLPTYDSLSQALLQATHDGQVIDAGHAETSVARLRSQTECSDRFHL
jgi:hypothetical protein